MQAPKVIFHIKYSNADTYKRLCETYFDLIIYMDLFRDQEKKRQEKGITTKQNRNSDGKL